jgi:hypothetical protein
VPTDDDEENLWSMLDQFDWDVVIQLLPSDEEIEKRYAAHYPVYIFSWNLFPVGSRR